MGKQFALCAVILVFGVTGALGNDTESRKWKNVGQWEIRVDATLNNGCFIIGAYASGDVFRIGFDRHQSKGYVIFANPAWKSLVEGTQYPLEMQFDSHDPWTGAASGAELGGNTVLMMNFTSPEIMKELANSKNLSVRYNGSFVTSLPLIRAGDAVDELIRCQAAVDKLPPKAATTTTDPFANKSSQSSADPFARQ